jgi:hypothetical protein
VHKGAYRGSGNRESRGQGVHTLRIRDRENPDEGIGLRSYEGWSYGPKSLVKRASV